MLPGVPARVGESAWAGGTHPPVSLKNTIGNPKHTPGTEGDGLADAGAGSGRIR